MRNRANIIRIVCIAILSIFSMRLFFLQVANYQFYKVAAQRNHQLTIKTFALRAAITDRNGAILACSMPIFQISFANTKQELQYIDKILQKHDYKSGTFKNNMLILKNLSWQDVAYICTISSLPMPNIEIDQIRLYPEHDICAHLIGYMQKSYENHYAGNSGIEKAYNNQLEGISGHDTFLINAKRIRMQKQAHVAAKTAQSMTLSLDIRLQRKAYELLKNKKQGAIMIADLHTGEILVAASFPAFDGEHFSKKNNAMIAQYLLDPLKPLFNLFLYGLFPIGSTIKPFMMLAMLQKNKTKPYYFCDGKYFLGKNLFRCHSNHGTVPLDKILQKSCNCAFYSFSEHLTQTDLQKIWNTFGFDAPVFNELNDKYVPFPSKQNWKQIDSLFMQIGQAGCTLSLAQLLRGYARLATGKKVEFTFLKQTQEKNFESLNIDPKHLKIMHQALFDTVNPLGANAYFHYKPIQAAGKTGTAQVRQLKENEYRKGNDNKPWHHRDHSLFCAFAPYDKPRFVGAIIVIHGGGGYLSAPILLEMLDETIKLNNENVTTAKNSDII